MHQKHLQFSPKLLMVSYFLTLTGCAQYQQIQDPNYGANVRNAIKLQTIHSSERPAKPEVGFEGEASRASFQQYLRSLHEKGGIEAAPPAIK